MRITAQSLRLTEGRLRMRTTPDPLLELQDKEVFVFGSNLGGRHGAGAARYALENFGAIYGMGHGLQGRSYAFPTLDQNLKQLDSKLLSRFALTFYHTAANWPHYVFMLTKVGCGLAGYTEAEMKWYFKFAPDNVVKPEGW
jgi:hypothetical protein